MASEHCFLGTTRAVTCLGMLNLSRSMVEGTSDGMAAFATPRCRRRVHNAGARPFHACTAVLRHSWVLLHKCMNLLIAKDRSVAAEPRGRWRHHLHAALRSLLRTTLFVKLRHDLSSRSLCLLA